MEISDGAESDGEQGLCVTIYCMKVSEELSQIVIVDKVVYLAGKTVPSDTR